MLIAKTTKKKHFLCVFFFKENSIKVNVVCFLMSLKPIVKLERMRKTG